MTLIARGALNFEHKLTATTLIYDKFLVEPARATRSCRTSSASR